MFDVIAFDADDTLWYNEHLYLMKRDEFIELLRPFGDPTSIGQILDKTEISNLDYYGYGIKSFALSMIETAVTLTDGRVSGEVVQTILNFSKEMREHPVQLYPQVRSVLKQLENQYSLMLITKGDLFEQESKIARSSIAEIFSYIEVVSEKNPETYRDLFQKYNINPKRLLMVGNSLKSDILPIVANGGTAVHIPAEKTWAHEHIGQVSPEENGYFELKGLQQLPAFISQISQSAAD